MKYFFFAILCGVALGLYAAWVRRSRRVYIDNFRFPEGLRRKFIEGRPELTAQQVNLVFDALREYFQVCRLAGKRLARIFHQGTPGLPANAHQQKLSR